MCTGSTEGFGCSRKQQSKRSKVRIHRLSRRKSRGEEEAEEEEEEMALKNLKLYMENISILKENEKLRRKATLLHQENLALMSEFQKKFSHLDRHSSTLFLLLHNSTIK